MSDSPFDEFQSEEQSSAANPISLADVLALRVPVHWTESVAVIEELCVVLTGQGEPSAIPEAESILITAQGAVLIRLGAANTQGVDAIGRMLNALLDPVTTPIPLRLFVAHAIGSDKYRSLQAFAEGLAYYARPDRTELIQALYLRCLSSSDNLPEVQPEMPPVPVQGPPPLPVEPKVEHKRRTPRWLTVAAALLVIALPFVFLRGSGSTDVLGPLRGFGAAAAASATSVARKAQEWMASSPRPDAKVEAEPVEPPAASGGARRPTQRARLTATGDARPPEPPVDGEAVPAAPAEQQALTFDPLVLLPVQPGTVVEGGLALPPVLPPVRAPVVRAEDPVVYNSASLDVQPPIIYSPKLPPVPPADPYWQGTNTMELLIDESGAVQQARLTSRPVRMSDMLLLSPAKTWKFYPALKNGQPVKYRLTMSWVVAPP